MTDNNGVPPAMTADLRRNMPRMSAAAYTAALAVIILAAVYGAPITAFTLLAAVLLRIGCRNPWPTHIADLAAFVVSLLEFWPLALLTGAWMLLPIALALYVVWRNRHLLPGRNTDTADCVCGHDHD